MVKQTILEIIDEREKVVFKELMEEVSQRLKPTFEGTPSWYCTAVKLDLEARGIIKRIPNARPQQIIKANNE